MRSKKAASPLLTTVVSADARASLLRSGWTHHDYIGYQHSSGKDEFVLAERASNRADQITAVEAAGLDLLDRVIAVLGLSGYDDTSVTTKKTGQRQVPNPYHTYSRYDYSPAYTFEPYEYDEVATERGAARLRDDLKAAEAAATSDAALKRIRAALK